MRPRRVCRWLAEALGAALAAGLAAAAAAWFFVEPVDEAAAAVYPGGTVLRDAAGDVLRVSLGAHDVDCRPYYAADWNDWIVKALVAVEDGSFPHHCGVRPLSALRAAAQNVFSGRRISGASTLTMQAVRLIEPHPKSLAWKAVEAIKALKLERRHDKLWILSQYLNRAPYGSNFVGVEAAAQGWFGKRAKDLGPAEAAALAGMVQRPSHFRPDRALDRALRRREYVLARMEKLGYLTARQREGAANVRPVVCRAPRPFKAPFFCDWALRRAPAGAGDVVTTLEPDAQARAERIVAEAARTGGHEVAAVLLRVDTGAVAALACSGNYFDPAAGQVNVARTPRPAGSTLKPFLTALALDRGLVSPSERLVDLPRAYKGYSPANFDGSHRGLVSVRDALVLSLNLPFVQMLERLGVERFGDTLRQLGFARLAAGGDAAHGLGMAIGSVEVSLVELAAAYGALARGGVYKPPCAVRDEVGPLGRVFSPGAAYLVSEMLSGDERSAAALGHVADVASARFAWKTGTSSAYRDAWCVAWNPEWVVAVWCGHKSGGFGDKALVGAKAAAPIAWRLARGAYPANAGPWFVAPPEVVKRRVCARSGKPAAPECPQTETGLSLAGSSATALCEMHRRGPDGAVVEVPYPRLAAFEGRVKAAAGLAIVKPAADAVIVLVPGVAQQKVVCTVSGNVPEGRLWWFADGVPRGETAGASPFVSEFAPGVHDVSCSTAEGVSASVRFTVKREDGLKTGG